MPGLKRASGVVVNFAIFATLLFVPAGMIVWLRAWIFLAVCTLGTTIAMFAIPADLLQERYGSPLQHGQPLADKILLPMFIVAFAAVVMLIPLDLFKWRLTAPARLPIALCGLALFVAGWWFIAWAMIANPYAAPVVKRQEGRGHRVIDRGPYRIMRPPMYAGFIPFMIGMALWLGSYTAAIAAIVPILLIGLRVVVEERFLGRELPGYNEYKTRVHYRLVPFIW